MTDLIRLDILSPIAELVINRPEKRNALSVEMWRAIPDLVETAAKNPDVKVLILHGGSSGSFAAGADIAEFDTVYATRERAAASGDIIAGALDALEACRKPVIAAIDGACVGGGVSLAMTADLRVAAQNARFGITPARLGLVYPPGDTRRLLSAIGSSTSKDLLFTGRLIDAHEALRIRLVDRVSAHDTALEDARTLAQGISAVSQWSTQAIKQMIRGLEAGWSDHDDAARSLFLDGFENDDFEEGRRAFLDKRAARFSYR